ncbi:MAG: tetratricopeptide repeat protein [Acidobacteriota bacterium]
MRRALLLTLTLFAGLHAAAGQTDATEQILKQAITLHQAGDMDGAIEAYRKYLKARPDSPIALSNLGAAYARAGRYEDAIAQYRHALKVLPGNVPVELNLALAYYKTGDTEKAAPVFEKVHKAAPDQLQPALLLADCWLAMGRNKDVAELLTPFSGGKPENPAVQYALGTALVRDNQVARGQALIDKILRHGNSAEALLLMGTTKLNILDFAGALEDLTKAAQLNPALPDVYSYYGVALLRTGDQKGATEAFRKELVANPNDFNANLQLGVLAKMDENFGEAVTYLRRALQVRPGDIGVRYQLASIDLSQGRVEEARAALEGMVKEAPAFTEAHVTLATVYYRLRRKEDGDRERAILQKLNAELQEKQPGVRPDSKPKP